MAAEVVLGDTGIKLITAERFITLRKGKTHRGHDKVQITALCADGAITALHLDALGSFHRESNLTTVATAGIGGKVRHRSLSNQRMLTIHRKTRTITLHEATGTAIRSINNCEELLHEHLIAAQQ